MFLLLHAIKIFIVKTNYNLNAIGIVIVFLYCNNLLIGQPYKVTRLNNSQPILSQADFTAAGVSDEGSNLNGPSMIRIPDWVPVNKKADPSANYYLYFADHTGAYIRMAWASNIEGPWTLYNTGKNIPAGQRGVLDLGPNTSINIGNDISIYGHIASPDVIINNLDRLIILYFHGHAGYNGTNADQKSFVAISTDGLNYNGKIEPVILGNSYFRVFEYNKTIYALTNDGTPYKARDFEYPWLAPEGFNYKSSLWLSHPDNPFQRDISNSGISKDVLRVRHTAVLVDNDLLSIFYSRRGDSPERIQMSTIDLSVGSWDQWDSTYPPVELLMARPGWEGGELPALPSETGDAPENVNQLRDPFVFRDTDGKLYLLYTGRGEDAIGLASLDQITGVSDEFSFDVPESFHLYQNYPNPFNPETTIKYALSNPGFVRLEIFNVQGQLLETLVDSYMPAGIHECKWSAVQYPSGNYFYRISTEKQYQTGKMIFIK